eukprot:scaffold4129_cov390-Prasinococcus_capsulatus_cf.AAC.10
MAAEEEAGGLGALQKNQFFADFLKEEFDPTTYSSTVLHRGHASEASRRLAEGIEVLESELRDEVGAQYSSRCSGRPDCAAVLLSLPNPCGLARSRSRPDTASCYFKYPA